MEISSYEPPHELVLPIPQVLIDQLAEQVAVEVMARVYLRLEVLASKLPKTVKLDG